MFLFDIMPQVQQQMKAKRIMNEGIVEKTAVMIMVHHSELKKEIQIVQFVSSGMVKRHNPVHIRLQFLSQSP